MRTAGHFIWEVRAARGSLRLGQVVGAIFLLAATAWLKPIVSYVYDAVRMSDWDQTTATVLAVEFDPEPDDDAPPLRVRYRYRYGDVNYEGSRADIAQGRYFFSELLSEMAVELVKHQGEASSVDCFVNPGLPTESVLDRKFYATVFGVRVLVVAVLAAVGGLTFGLFTREIAARRHREELRAIHPNQPWLWRDDWAAGRIHSSTGADTRILLGVALVYLVVVLPLGLWILFENGGAIWSLPGGTLIVLGWGAFNMARQSLQKSRRHDAAEFQLAGATGVIGGPLAGVAVLRMAPSDDAQFRVSLECIELRHGGGEEEGISEVVLWRDSTVIVKTLPTNLPRTTAVPVYFAIPFNSQPSQTETGASIVWRLKVGPEGQAGLQGYAMFETPVFRTPESSRKYKGDPALMQQYEAKAADLTTVLKNAGCHIARLPDGGELIRFSLIRKLILFAGVAILLACAIAIALILKFLYFFGWAIFPGVFGVAVLLGVTEMLLWQCRIEVRPESIQLTSGLAGFRKQRSFARDEELELLAGTEFAMREKTWYAVYLSAADGQRFLVAKRLPSQREAEMLAAWLQEKLQRAA